ncbi:hypothetical protein LLY42_00270 [Pseudomonas frederiksbergensis]|nr:hypothetical protein LLY42_00270 [Pseudomonas frederiksbergensis]
MFPLIKNLSAVGTLDAKIHNNFKFQEYKGVITFFFDGSSIGGIYLISEDKLSETTWNEISLVFSQNIQEGRYELPNDKMFPIPLHFQEIWIDETGEKHGINYITDKNVGHVDVEQFDIEKGIFKASFNFTILDQGNRHQTIGNIDVTGWSDVNRK